MMNALQDMNKLIFEIIQKSKYGEYRIGEYKMNEAQKVLINDELLKVVFILQNWWY